MATAPQEMEDLSRVSGALLVNFGTISDKAGMIEAGTISSPSLLLGQNQSKLHSLGKWVNRRKNPIVFDPVAVGATRFRFETAQGKPQLSTTGIIHINTVDTGRYRIIKSVASLSH